MFGAPSTPFGAPAPSGFGQAPAFGAAPAAPSAFGQPSGFGAAPQPASTFGQATSGFGQQPAASTGFGAAPSAFGQAPSAFGQPAASTGFGSPSPAPAFGMKPAQGLFGSAPSAFGQPALGGQQQTGTAAVPYQETSKNDGSSSIILQAITAMPQYEQKSFEELRLEDYLAGNKGTQGQAPVSTGFGGFGAAPQPAPAPTGLFGAPAAAPTSLFGSSTPAPVGNLFGSSSATPAPSTGFGGFGAAPQPAPTSTGLFGGELTTAVVYTSAPTSLFGSTTPAPSGNLFGSAATPGERSPSTGFGGFGAAPQPGKSQPIFQLLPCERLQFIAQLSCSMHEAPASTAPAAAPTSLFGNTPATGFGGFGASPAAAPSFGQQPGKTLWSPTSLFGNPAPGKNEYAITVVAKDYSAPSSATIGGLFGNAATPAPSSGLFGQPAAAPSFGSQPATNLATQQQAALQYATLLSNHTIGPSADALLAQQLAAVEKQKKDMELMRAWRGNYEAGSKVVATSNYEQESGDNWTSAAPSSALISNYRAAPRSAAKIRPRGYSPATKPSAVASMGRKNGGSPILSPNRFTRLLLTNGISNGNGDSSHLQSPDATSATAPKPVDSVSPQGKPSPAHDFYNQVVGSPDGTNVVASPVHTVSHSVPKLTKTGYNVYPPISELETMSEADLAAVADFKVERPGYGSVAWDGSVDVRGVDLDSVVVIETKNVSVYDDAELNGDKPRQGSKLNRPAVITMFGIYPKGGAESSVEAKEKLKKKIEKSTKKMGADLLSFDADGGVWTFRVGHFSRYGLDDEDSD
ncbi:hypothetical protein THAPSDRAFT_262891, partial [Thalassiosira pseudonana CCMP1335]